MLHSKLQFSFGKYEKSVSLNCLVFIIFISDMKSILLTDTISSLLAQDNGKVIILFQIIKYLCVFVYDLILKFITEIKHSCSRRSTCTTVRI